MKRSFPATSQTFECEVISLPQLSIDKIVGDPYFSISLRMMKAIRDGSLIPCLREVRNGMELLFLERQDVNFVLECFFYALNGDIDKAEVLDIFKDIQNQELKQTVMTAAEQLIEEGLYKGHQLSVIKNLEIRFESVPEGLKEAIYSVTNEAKLDELHVASVKCSSIEDFSKNL